MAESLQMFMRVLFIIVLLGLYVVSFTLAIKISSANRSLSHDDECLILLQFKENISTNDSASFAPYAYSKVASWKLNKSEGRSDCCFWDGVECNGGISLHHHVIGLDLSSSFLYGPISSDCSLFDLIHLRRLNLADNNFRHSQIPSRMGLLSQLTYLNLSYSRFSGHDPKEISQLNQLVSLDLSGNNFRGSIPSLASLSRLSYLDLSDNGFYGWNLSEWVGMLPNLSVLDLTNNNLSCAIPPSIGNQTQLRQLYLDHNHMVGQIPTSLMNLTRLRELSLGENEFIGSLPSLESLSNLTALFVGFNNLDRWKLPNWLGKLNKLTFLTFIDVNLYGEIPSLIYNLTKLEFLELTANQIEGSLPPIPSTMSKLESLYLGNNLLEGPIPSSLSNLKNLNRLYLGNNNISGTVEVDIFLPLQKLEILHLGGNRIELSVLNDHTIETLPKFKSLELASCNLRVFPDFLRFQDQLINLNLDQNRIDGLIPEWMGKISKGTLRQLTLAGNSLTGFEQHPTVIPWVGLQSLDLSFNMLSGSVPMPPSTTLVFFIANNNLTGEIPQSMCDLTSLQILDLSSNKITGSIPPCLEKISNSLSLLNLRGNTLRGTIPEIFINGSNIQIIDLSENELEGKLPRSLEKCASLQMLDLGNNRLEDMFPFWLIGALSELQVLILRSNKFYGSLRISSKTNSEYQRLRIIDLSYNSFSGDLPYEYFEALSALKELEPDLAYMQTTIQISLEAIRWTRVYLYSMKMNNKGMPMDYDHISNIFMGVDLSSNKFEGMIQESIESLGGIQLLNFSNNELSGVIPSSMGNLAQLESLDLSGNKLTGKIPQELLQLNFLVYLNVSYNNLTGSIPQGGQFDTFQNISFVGNPALCGVPLSKKCGNSKASKPPTFSFDKATESDFPNGVDWAVMFSGVGSGLVIGLLSGNHLTTRFYKWFLKRFRK